MSTVSWRAGPAFLLFTLTLVNTNNWADRQVVPILVPAIKGELALSDTEMGLISGLAFSLIYAVAAFVFGYLADRHSRRLVVLFGLVSWSIATAACGLVESFWGMFAARFVTGIGEASLYPCAMSLLADAYGADRRGRAIGILGASTALGGGLGIGLGGWLVEMIGWRNVFFAYGLSGLLVLPLLLVMKEPERTAMEEHELHEPPWRIVREALLDVRLISVWTTGMLLIASASAWIIWAPSYFVRDLGFDIGELGLVFGVSQLFGGVAGSVIGGQLGDRYRKRRFAGQLRVSAISALITAPLFAVTLMDVPREMLLLMAAILPFTIFAAFPNYQTIVAEIVPAKRLGLTFAVHVLFLAGIGSALGPVLVGWLSDVTGSLRIALMAPLIGTVLAGLGALWSEHIVRVRTPKHLQ